MTDGLVTLPSGHSVAETIDRLAAAATGAGLRIFARIDHAAGAAEVDMPLRPTELLIFGRPSGGTPLMLDAQTAGLDLPLRALAWEDTDGRRRRGGLSACGIRAGHLYTSAEWRACRCRSATSWLRSSGPIVMRCCMP